MAQSRLSRRVAVAALGAGMFGGATADALAIFDANASRLKPLSDPPYIPPTSVSTVNDLYSRMTAGIRVDGQGPFDFLVDTGANQSVISTELAQALNLPVNASALVNGVAGGLMAPTTFAVLDVAGHRKPGAAFSVLPEAAIGGKGLLGLDHLGGQRLTLDFRMRALRIEAAGRVWGSGRDVVVRGSRVSGQLTLVDADLSGMKIAAFIDSGAQNTIGNRALRSLAIQRQVMGVWLPTTIISATGQSLSADIAALPNLRLGGIRFPNWPVAFADLHTFDMWNLNDRPAILLGIDILSRFEAVSIDFARDEVRFRMPGAVGAMIERT